MSKNIFYQYLETNTFFDNPATANAPTIHRILYHIELDGNEQCIVIVTPITVPILSLSTDVVYKNLQDLSSENIHV